MTVTVIPCPLCDRPTDGQICALCTKGLHVRLEALPELYAALAPCLAPGSAPAGLGRGSTPVYAPMPVREEVLDLRGPGGMVGVLEDWLDAVRRDRGIDVDPHRGGTESRLAGAVGGLIANLPWIAGCWPQASELATEVRDLVRDVRGVLFPVERGIRLGTCPSAGTSGETCGAVLRYRAGEQIVTCRWCSATYPPATWAGLKQRIDEGVAAHVV
ncbi:MULTISPECIES: hypothetical protein [Streptomyces]|uniref:hypothetical protein n=1 Tax=Streptomyces TaxID=1883 RepID=UPI003690574D